MGLASLALQAVFLVLVLWMSVASFAHVGLMLLELLHVL